MYEKLFSKGKINGCELRNRVIMSPMDDCLGQASGEITERAIEYYASKAKGGTGLVEVGFVGVIGPEYGGVSMSGQCFLRDLDRPPRHEHTGRARTQLRQQALRSAQPPGP